MFVVDSSWRGIPSTVHVSCSPWISSLQCCEFDQEGGVFDNWERMAAHYRGESGELHLDLPQVFCPSLPGRAGLQG